METATDTMSTTRVIDEGYGPGAWHGADLKAALGEVTPALAFWRPAAARHNIAEITLHHAYCVRSVRERLSGKPTEPFVLEGDDWFAVSDEQQLAWSRIQAIVDGEQSRLRSVVADLASGRTASPLGGDEQISLILGITCHAVYHAGQVQLIKKLHG